MARSSRSRLACRQLSAACGWSTGTSRAVVPKSKSTQQQQQQQQRKQQLPPPAEMNWENLQTCTKLHHCIYETLRMYPVLPNIGRRAIRNTTLPTGGGEDGTSPVAVAEGTTVMCCLYLMHRRPEEWGPDANAFRPGRWESRQPGFEYAPFGGGPRICPGKLFGLVEMFYVTARVLQHFQAIHCSQTEATVKKLGAGVMLPPERATTQFRIASAAVDK